jgi:hypothetical protein
VAPLIQKHSVGTDATVRMLYLECRGLPYWLWADPKAGHRSGAEPQV